MSKSNLQFNRIADKSPRHDSIAVVKDQDLITGIRVGDLPGKEAGIQAFEKAVLKIASQTGTETPEQQRVLRERIQDAYAL